jgi:hypothetical protein
MPALLVQRRRLALNKLRPELVARNIGRHHFGTARSARLGLRQYGRQQDGAWVAVESDVVIVEDMSTDTVDECRVGDRPPISGRKERRGRIVCRRKLAAHQINQRLAGAGNHDRETIGHARPRNGTR